MLTLIQKKSVLILMTFSFLSCASAQSLNHQSKSMANVYQKSLQYIFRNFHQLDIAPGAVIASTTKDSPDYYYHWVRDAGLTQDSLFQVYQASRESKQKIEILDQARKWIGFEIITQNNALTSEFSLGEPRFYVDGRTFTGPWSRPQNDGPAVRAMAAMQWAKVFLDLGEKEFVKEVLYRAELPAKTLIKRDLEYIAYNWSKASIDPWEEVLGTHLFNRAFQLKALRMGAKFAVEQDDPLAAKFYSDEADKIDQAMNRFLNTEKGYVIETVDWAGGWHHKDSNLDIAVLIAANSALFETSFFKKNKNFFIKTLEVLEENFKTLYAINRDFPEMAAAIGRYPEDVYNGYTTEPGNGKGNPWFLTTHAAAEFYCKLGRAEATMGFMDKAAHYKAKGLRYFDRTLKHIDQNNGEMREEFSKETGFMTGAENLTWSYASYLTAYLACQ